MHVQNQVEVVVLRPLNIMIKEIPPCLFIDARIGVIFEDSIMHVNSNGIEAYLFDTLKVLFLIPVRDWIRRGVRRQFLTCTQEPITSADWL